MAIKLERADRRPDTDTPQVRLNGKPVDFTERTFDALTFARAIKRSKKAGKPTTLAEREARLRAAEAKLGLR